MKILAPPFHAGFVPKFIAGTDIVDPSTLPPLTAATPALTSTADNDALNKVSNLSPSLAAVLRPQAAYRWLLPSIAAITPQYVENILRGGLAGNHVQMWELFDLMCDSSPEIASCIGEYVDGISGKNIIIEPYHEEDMSPTPEAIRNQKLVSAALRNMNPDPASDENSLRGTVRDILFARFHGQSVLEADWYDTYGTGQLNRIAVSGVGSVVAPRCTFWVHPVCYAWDMSGRLGLRMALNQQIQDLTKAAKNFKGGSGAAVSMAEPPAWNFISAQPMPSYLTEFPANKFLIGILKAKSGTALGGSALRALAAWWVFENFSADYAMDLAQIFGVPFRVAHYAPGTSDADKNYVQMMLQNMGSQGWAMLPDGVKLDFEKAMATGAESPQGFLIKLCHEQYRKVILRQTMTGSGHGGASSGSKSGMAMEAVVKEQCLNAGADFACDVLRSQLARFILKVNLGDDSELPFITMSEKQSGTLEDAQIIAALAPLSKDLIGVKYTRKLFNIPPPDKGEETLSATPAPAAGKPSEKIPGTQPPKPGAGGDADSGEPMDAEAKIRKQKLEMLEAQAATPVPSADVKNLAAALADDLAPVADEFQRILKISDPALFEKKLKEFIAEHGPLAQLLPDINANPRAAKVINAVSTQAMADALKTKPETLKR